MSPLHDAGKAAADAKRHIESSPNPIAVVAGSVWHWVNGVASSVGHILSSNIPSALRTILAAVKDIVDAYREVIDAIRRLETWIERRLLRGIINPIQRHLTRLDARVRKNFKYLVALIYIATTAVFASAVKLIHAETSARVRAVAHAEALARLEVKRVHQQIEREAASGYRLAYSDRVALITRLLDFAAVRAPFLKHLIGRVAGIVLDLLSVDDPFARLLAGFFMRQVVDRLGIDKAAGALIRDLIAPLLGAPKPHDVHDVVADISARLVALETFAATFMENGGSQVEQAGDDWKAITSITGSAAILAFTAQAVVAPDAWARELSGTIGRAANDIATATGKLIRKG